MLKHLALTLLAAACLQACRFESQVPSRVVVRCEQDSDCPPDRDLCHPTLNRCVSRGDTDAPFLVSHTLSTGQLRADARATLRVTANEDLGVPPTFWLVSPRRSRPLALDDAASDPSGLTWQVSIDASLEDGEGVATIFVALTDVAGNAAPNLVVDSVRFDFTPPRVLPESIDVRPGVLRPGVPLVLFARADEELRPGSTLRLDDGTNVLRLPATQGRDNVSMRVATESLASSGTLSLTLEGWVDLAGNEAAPIDLPSVELDGTPPRLEALVIETPVVSRVPGFDVLRFTFTASGASTEEVRVGGRGVSCTATGDARRCETTVAVDDVEGPVTVVVRATDVAGNTAELRETVRFDFTSPELLTNSAVVVLLPGPGNPLLQPRHAGPGTTVRLSFALSEPTPTPGVSAGALPLALSSQQGLAWTFTGVVPSTLSPEGAATPRVEAVDAVGNRATFDLPLAAPGLVFDVTPPAPPSTSLRLVRRPWSQSSSTTVTRVEVRGGPGSVEGAGLLRAFAFGPTPLTGELARFETPADGDLGAVPISSFDVRVPWFDFVDLAGNASAPVRAGLQTFEGVFSPLSPQAVEAISVSFDGPFAKSNFPAASKPALGQEDGEAATVEGQGRWLTTAARAPPGSFAVGSLRSIESTGRVWALSDPYIYEWDGDRWRLLPISDPENDGPAFELKAADVVDAFEQGLYAFRENAAWRWTGASWAAVPLSDPEVDGLAPSVLGNVVFDPLRRKVLALGATAGQGSSQRALWSFEGNSWRRLATLPTPLTTASIQQLYASRLHGKLLVVSDGRLYEVTGATLAFLGTIPLEATLAEAPPANPFASSFLGAFSVSSTNRAWRWDASTAVFTAMTVGASGPGGWPLGALVVGWTGGSRPLAVAGASTWSFSGNRWNLENQAFTTNARLARSAGRFWGTAFFNPVTRFVEMMGGTGWFGLAYTDAVIWDGFNAYDAGTRDFLPGSLGILAQAPDGGALAVSQDGRVAQFRPDGAWSPAVDAGFPAGSTIVAWNPLSGRYLQQRLEGDGGRVGEYEWTGTDFTPVLSGERWLPDGGTDVPWGGASVTMGPLLPQNRLTTVINDTAWVREDAGWQVDSSGVGQGCFAYDPVRSRSFILAAQLFSNTGQGWSPLVGAPVTPEPGWPGELFGCYAAWDQARDRFVTTIWGAEVWEFDPGYRTRPALELRLPIAEAGFPAQFQLEAARIRVVAGASGTFGVVPLDSVSVEAWSDGEWRSLATGAFPASAPAELTAVINTAAELTAMGVRPGGTLRLRVTPSGLNGAQPAQVRVDFAQLSLDVTTP